MSNTKSQLLGSSTVLLLSCESNEKIPLTRLFTNLKVNWKDWTKSTTQQDRRLFRRQPCRRRFFAWWIVEGEGHAVDGSEIRLTSCFGESTIIYRVLPISGGAGFLPSTVSWRTRSASIEIMQTEDGTKVLSRPRFLWRPCQDPVCWFKTIIFQTTLWQKSWCNVIVRGNILWLITKFRRVL